MYKLIKHNDGPSTYDEHLIHLNHGLDQQDPTRDQWPTFFQAEIRLGITKVTWPEHMYIWDPFSGEPSTIRTWTKVSSYNYMHINPRTQGQSDPMNDPTYLPMGHQPVTTTCAHGIRRQEPKHTHTHDLLWFHRGEIWDLDVLDPFVTHFNHATSWKIDGPFFDSWSITLG